MIYRVGCRKRHGCSCRPGPNKIRGTHTSRCLRACSPCVCFVCAFVQAEQKAQGLQTHHKQASTTSKQHEPTLNQEIQPTTTCANRKAVIASIPPAPCTSSSQSPKPLHGLPLPPGHSAGVQVQQSNPRVLTVWGDQTAIMRARKHDLESNQRRTGPAGTRSTAQSALCLPAGAGMCFILLLERHLLVCPPALPACLPTRPPLPALACRAIHGLCSLWWAGSG